jgi:nicotinate-nucleotide pyrophosphorylase (carboxylating)
VKDPDIKAIAPMVQAALEEDGARSDATVSYLGIDDEAIAADVIAGGDGVVCGVDVAREVFRQMDVSILFDGRAQDGERCQVGGTICSVQGAAKSILSCERVALNFMQRLTGIATLAAAFVARVAGTGVTILDTRKTTPLWRDLEKYAVRCGGAQNHRRDLQSMVLVKENHVRALGGEIALIERLKTAHRDKGLTVEVEVDSIGFLKRLLGAPVDRVMLDNFTPAQVEVALTVITAVPSSSRMDVEVSGGVTLDNIDGYAISGVDYISVGALTHSAPALAMSLEVR